MTSHMFSYPPDDLNTYLSWYKNDFASVFVGTNSFFRNPDRSRTPDELLKANADVDKMAKSQGAATAVSWQEVAELCGFDTIAHVNRALRLTGSQRIQADLSCPTDTKKLQKACDTQNIIMPYEGDYSPMTELTLERFFSRLGQDNVVVADHFGVSPRPMKTVDFRASDQFSPAEIHTNDGSLYVTMYIDYHYFLICQTAGSRSKANPADFFEGFFANDTTCDLWGIGDLANFDKYRG